MNIIRGFLYGVGTASLIIDLLFGLSIYLSQKGYLVKWLF